MSVKTLAFVHHKGGTGKTSSCISIAGYLAKAGKKVLVVDLDPQGNATSGLGVNKNVLTASMYEVMSRKANIKNIILETYIENIHIAPATTSLMNANMRSYRSMSDALFLHDMLKNVKKNYNYILIDTPPTYGHFIINAAIASDEVILVSDPGIFAVEGIEPLQRAFNDYNEKLHRKIKIGMVILTKCRNMWIPFFNNPTKEIAEELQNYFHENIFFVPYSDSIYGSQIKGLPISHYRPRSNVGIAYEKIANEILR